MDRTFLHICAAVGRHKAYSAAFFELKALVNEVQGISFRGRTRHRWGQCVDSVGTVEAGGIPASPDSGPIFTANQPLGDIANRPLVMIPMRLPISRLSHSTRSLHTVHGAQRDSTSIQRVRR